MYECPECGVRGEAVRPKDFWTMFKDQVPRTDQIVSHAAGCSRQQKPVEVDRKVEMMSEEEARQAGRDKPDDPWAHRSERMKCRTCMWYITKNAAESMTDLGRCRKRSPTMDGYPVVFPDDWCGDHKVDENAK